MLVNMGKFFSRLFGGSNSSTPQETRVTDQDRAVLVSFCFKIHSFQIFTLLSSSLIQSLKNQRDRLKRYQRKVCTNTDNFTFTRIHIICIYVIKSVPIVRHTVCFPLYKRTGPSTSRSGPS